MTKFIEPYNPAWKTTFEKIKQVIETALGHLSLHVDIQHVGSTSVQGMYAKPILDIDIIIKNKSLLHNITVQLKNLGYIPKGELGIAGRFAFRQSSQKAPLTAEKQKWQTHHLYVCYADSLALKNHILFRDALKNNNHLVQQYISLKKALTQNQAITMEEYTTQKTGFIISVLAMAGLNKAELDDITNANT